MGLRRLQRNGSRPRSHSLLLGIRRARGLKRTEIFGIPPLIQTQSVEPAASLCRITSARRVALGLGGWIGAKDEAAPAQAISRVFGAKHVIAAVQAPVSTTEDIISVV